MVAHEMNTEGTSAQNQSNFDATGDVDSVIVQHMTSVITDHRCVVVIPDRT